MYLRKKRDESLTCLRLTSRLQFLAFLAAFAFPVLALFSPAQIFAQSGDPQPLAAGASVTRELSGGQTHSYQVTLAQGQCLEAIVEQRGIDVVVVVFAPGGQKVIEVDSPNGTQGPEPVLIVAETSGDYRLEVRSLEKSASPGRYEAKLVAIREATQADRDRVTARQAGVEGDRLFEQNTKAALTASIGKYEEALSLYRTLDDKAWQATMLYNLGFVWRAMGEMPKALDAYSQALALNQGGANRKEEAATLNDLGQVNISLGETAKAQELLNRALVMRKEIGDRNGEAITLNNLGVVFRTLGEFEKARQYYEQALLMRRELGDKRGEGVTLHNLGVVYGELGDLPQAMEHFRQAVTLMRAVGDKHGEATSLNNLGGVYRALGDWSQAREQHERSLALKREVGDKRGEAMALNQIGFADQATGDSQRALDHYQQALQLAREIGDRLTQADILNNLGMVYRSLSEWPQAMEHYEQSLALFRVGGERRREAVILRNIATVQREQGKLTEARASIEQAVALLEFIRSAAGSENNRAAFFATVTDFYDFQIDLLMQMNKANPMAGHNQQALRVSERSRARSLLDLLNKSRADLREGVAPSLLEQERSLRQRLTSGLDQLTRLLSGRHTPEQQAAAEKEISTLTDHYRKIEAEIRQTSPRYAALMQPQPLNVSEIQQQILDQDTLLLEYALGQDHSYLWAVTPNSVTSYQLPPRAEIEAAARRVYELLIARQPRPGETELDHQARIKEASAGYSSQSAALSRMLLGQAASQLGHKRLLIVAPGILSYLPFAALPVPEKATGRQGDKETGGKEDPRPVPASPRPPVPDQPLIAEHEIVNLPSASVLSVIRRDTAGRTAAAKSVVVLADPVFEANDPRVALAAKKSSGAVVAKGSDHDKLTTGVVNAELTRAVRGMNTGRAGFSRLPFSGEEADAILSSSPAGLKATSFRASRATATSDELSQYRIVHFATHGLLNSEHPELSGLVFSLIDEQGRAQDGFLRLHEIYNLKLNADLVVLSACQTGLGREIKGEGLVGLTRGFMYAGAPRVVASLWQVDDLATAELMKRFYQGMLKDGLRPAAALRAAQMELSQTKRWAAPYFWAAFTLQGEWK